MLDISFLLDDLDFVTTFQIVKNQGEWQDGEYVVSQAASETVSGVVRATGKDDLEMLPEADRISGSITFWTRKPIDLDLTASPPPRLRYAGNTYKIMHLENWQDSGYTKMIGIMLGRNGTNEN